MVEVPLLPLTNVMAAGAAPIVKSGVTVIVNANDCEWLRLPLVPVIVIVKAAGGVPPSTFTVATEVTVPPAGGVTGLVEKDTCTPPGNAPASKVTGELNDPVEVMVAVSVAELPAPTLRFGVLSDNEKSALDVMVREKDVV